MVNKKCLERGKLLYEKKIGKKRKLCWKCEAWALASIFLFLSILLYIYIFRILPPEKGREWAMPIWGIIAAFCLFSGAFCAVRAIGGLKDLRIYEKGIALPYLSFRQVLQKEEKFIPFTDIEAIYPNEPINKYRISYVVIKLRNKKRRVIPLHKKDIEYDEIAEIFKKLLEEKIKIIKDRLWAPGRGEVKPKVKSNPYQK